MAEKDETHAKGGYDYTFVDQYPHSYECSVCLLVMREPYIVSCCGKKFCRTCTDMLPSKKCPVCTQPFTSMQEKELQRQILDLKVKCSIEECQWIGELRDIDSHLDDQCQHSKVECSLGCGSSMKRGDLSEHCQHSCTKRSIEVQLASVINKLEGRVADLEDICRDQSQYIKQLQTELSCCRTNILLPRYSVCVNGLEELWFSPPFYTHPSGYTLRLKFITSIYRLTGKFDVFCQLQLISGGHDCTLGWPVDIYCVVEVLCNQSQDKARTVELKIIGAGKPHPGKTPESEKQIVKAQVHFHRNGILVTPLLTLFSADVAVISLVAKPNVDLPSKSI